MGVGALLGYVICAVIVPMLWRRQLSKALPIVYIAGASCSGIAALVLPILPTIAANAAGCLSMVVTAALVRTKMPAVFGEALPGHCLSCGYNLRGIHGVDCPECGCPQGVPIPTLASRFAALTNELRWWLMPTWIAPALVYYLFMAIPRLAIVLKELERWPTSATVGLIVASAFLLASSMAWLTLRGVPLRSRLIGALALGALLLPANYLALWCFIIGGAIFGFYD